VRPDNSTTRQGLAEAGFLLPMPSTSPRPCKHPGCGHLVRDGSGYCAAHQGDRKINRFADERRGSSTERGYGAEWRKRRERIMQRDCGLCQPCRNAGRVTVATAVDHIVPKAEGGTEEDGNLQAICKPCHDTKTAREAAKGRGV
jgi:5-methylcytosine-specific restriction enzyme A